MAGEEIAWAKALNDMRRRLVCASVDGDGETVEQLKQIIEDMERHARSQGWPLTEG